ncbi:MAG: ATP-binding cassette domain-containing protein [Oscillospiraceae bacterium]|nr:ATP-binding cassette domain-containing protein [Oscillospiraceae bacterium]
MVKIITTKDLQVSYPNKQVLKNICCEIPKNKITAIIGSSGCGKTTFLKSINRIVEEEGGRLSGDIFIHGKRISEIPKEVLRKQVGLVFQSPLVFPFSVEKNMLYPLNYHFNFSKIEQKNRVKHSLQLTGLYEEIKQDLTIAAHKLSGGQKQRLSIARCLCIEPSVLMLDEPCSALDMKNTIYIEKLLVELKESVTVVIVTHNLSQAKRIADYVIYMENGELIEADDYAIFSRVC